LAKSKLRARDVILPVTFVILATFLFVAGFSTNPNGTASFFGIQIPALVGNNGSSSGTPGSTSGSGLTGSGGGSSALPLGQVSYNMQLIASYTDGSNQTISTVGNPQLPSLAQIKVNGRAISHVTARALIGYQSPVPLPANAVAHFIVNFTALNEQTSYLRWRAYDIHSPFTSANNTLALALLPDFPLTGLEVYSDICNALSNGTINCSGQQNPNGVSRRIDWGLRTTVTIIDQNGFTLIPTSSTFTTISSADFSENGDVSGCTNCGGAPPSGGGGGTVITTGGGLVPGGSITATQTPSVTTVTNKADVVKITPTPAITTPTGPTGTQIQTVVNQKVVTVPQNGQAKIGLNNIKSNGDGTGKVGGATGGRGLGGGSSGTHCFSYFPEFCLAASLLPSNYVPLSWGNFTLFINQWSLTFIVVLYLIIVIFGTIGIFWLLGRKHKRKR